MNSCCTSLFFLFIDLHRLLRNEFPNRVCKATTSNILQAMGYTYTDALVVRECKYFACPSSGTWSCNEESQGEIYSARQCSSWCALHCRIPCYRDSAAHEGPEVFSAGTPKSVADIWSSGSFVFIHVHIFRKTIHVHIDTWNSISINFCFCAN